MIYLSTRPRGPDSRPVDMFPRSCPLGGADLRTQVRASGSIPQSARCSARPSAAGGASHHRRSFCDHRDGGRQRPSMYLGHPRMVAMVVTINHS